MDSMDETPIDFYRLKTACEQLHAQELEGVEDPVDQLAKKVEFAVEIGAIAMLFLAEQLREHLAEAGLSATGLRVGVVHNHKNQDCIRGPWQACIEGQWVQVPDDAAARRALEGIDQLLTRRKSIGKRNSADPSARAITAGLVEQTIISTTMLNIQGIGKQSWRTLDLAPAAVNKLVARIAGPEAMALSQNLELEANTPLATGRRTGPRL